MTKRRGFSLIELLIAMAILMVLSGAVYPVVSDIGDLSRPASMAATVRQVRAKIIYRTGLGGADLSPEGYPNRIEPAWFSYGLPADVWTNQPLNVQVVHGGKDATAPRNKFFVIRPDGRPAGHTAWYNAANGSFCALVPKWGTTEEQLELFNRVNGAGSIAGQG